MRNVSLESIADRPAESCFDKKKQNDCINSFSQEYKSELSILNANDYLYAPTKNIVMKKGEGIFLFDSNGKNYIDCAAATFNLSLGYSHKAVLDSVRSQLNMLVHTTSSYMTEPVGNLAKKLVEVSPEGLNKVHLKVCGGSTANEGAIKMAQVVTDKTEVISFFRSHIGQTIYTMNLSGNAFRKKDFNFPNHNGLLIPAPYCYRCFYNQNPDTCGLLCVERINDFIDFGSSGKIAALIMEPVFGNGDNIVPPKKFFPAIRKLCDERDIALIFDEIQTGIGRTGKMFAAQYFNVIPDIITSAKGLGGTGFQIAAIICKEKFNKMNPMYHSFTYGSNVMASAAALKTLEIINNELFLANVTKTGKIVLDSLFELQKKYPIIGDVRGIGLMIGFEIIDPDDGSPDIEKTKKIMNAAFSEGLIMRDSRYGFGNTLKIRPALTMTVEETELLCHRLKNSFIKVFGN